MNKYQHILKRWLIVITLLLFPALSQAQTSENLDFEQGRVHWAFPTQGSLVEHQGRDYSTALKIDCPPLSSLYATRDITGIIPEATYKLSVWARAAAGSEKPVKGSVKIEYYNAANQSPAQQHIIEELKPNGEWQQIQVKLQATSDTERAVIFLRVYDEGAVLFNDVSFEISGVIPAISVAPDRNLLSQDSRGPLTYTARLAEDWTDTSLPLFEVIAFPLDHLGKPNKSAGKVLSYQTTKTDNRTFQLAVQFPENPTGSYILEFSLRHNQQLLKPDTTKYVFTYKHDRKPENLTETGTILHQGKPFFPIGMYHAVNFPRYNNGLSAESFDELKQHDIDYQLLAEHGFNAVQGNITNDLELLGASLDIAQKHGIAVDIPLYMEHGIAKNRDISLQKIQRFKNHQAVLSWKITDEPDLHTKIAHEIPDVYYALKAANSPQPIELTLMGGGMHFWPHFLDLMQVDVYPVPGRPLTQVSTYARAAKENMQPWQNLSLVIQSGWTKDLKTQPTVAQARSMVYLALIEGAKGIWWYSMYDPDWNLTKTPLWPHFKAINAEAQALSEPVMLGEHITTVTGNNPKVLFRALKHEGKLYVLITNPENEPQKIKLQFPADLSVNSGKTLDRRDLPLVQNQQLELSLEAIGSQTLIFDID